MSSTPFECSAETNQYDLSCQIVHNDYRYSEASAAWTLICAMVIFFMRAGFMMIELSFSSEVPERRNIVFLKYLDVSASAVGFWLFGFQISNINGLSNSSIFLNSVVVIEDQVTCNRVIPYISWFFKFGFASNTATLMGGLLVRCKYKLRVLSAFLNALIIAGIVHPIIARIVWGADRGDFLSPYRFCRTEEDVAKNVTIGDGYFDRIYLLDFAGGGAVHIVGGMASLGLTLIVSTQLWWDKRVEEKENKHKLQKQQKQQKQLQQQPQQEDEDPNEDQEPKNLKERLCKPTYFIRYMYPKNGGDDNIEQAASGVFILWFGWFAFNCGTTESLEGPLRDYPVYSNIAGRIAVNMITSAAGGGITATLIATTVQTLTKGKAINCNEIANGILTSLVAITSNCPYVDSITAFYIGVIAVLLYHLGVYIEYLANIFDTGRVIPVHAFGGTWSLLAGGLFVLHNSEYEYIRETYEGVCFCNLELPQLNYIERLGAQVIGVILISSFTLVMMSVFYITFFCIRLDLILKLGNTKVGNAICDRLAFGKGGFLLICQKEDIPFNADYDGGGNGSQLDLQDLKGASTTET
ncbi:Ammonium transporter 1 member 3-like [Oopsacas minuta]|uniref:Ammonium transporter 1 member 3-like n=1 Tax=Oopsacas minuta TaxID=111878 RepID=A0AAV7JZW2_9METZ|nr:Ammonium transporter 1 member 3-like [Oopsacas minuta]